MDTKLIKSKKIYEQVADMIVHSIRTGDLRPGDRMESVEQLAKKFGVSRSAVREALSGLRVMGLVEMRQGEGTFITEFNASSFSLPPSIALTMKQEDIRELAEVRKILEVGTVGLAAVHYGKEDLLAMEKALHDMEEAKGRDEVGEKADLDFHMAIAHGSGNQLLINLMSSVADITLESMRETRRLILYSEKQMSSLLEEHRMIYEAVKKRDAAEAEKAMAVHLAEVDRVLSAYID